MGIIESFQHLNLGEQIGVATFVVAAAGLIVQLRTFWLDRSDRLRTERANLVLERPKSQLEGAAVFLGPVATTGEKAGQHFIGAMRNEGPHVAEEIEVTASLGRIGVVVASAPKWLPPYS